jgi:hypothetical protein
LNSAAALRSGIKYSHYVPVYKQQLKSPPYSELLLVYQSCDFKDGFSKPGGF